MEAINLNKANNTSMLQNVKPGALALLQCKCPRCRRGDMFIGNNPWHLKRTMKMHNECPVCGQPFNIEVGFYYGSSYVSYAFTLAASAASFVLWWFTIGFSLEDNRIFYWLTFNSIFLLAMQPYFMRVARTGWLSFFVRYDRNWKTNTPKALERTNSSQQNNW